MQLLGENCKILYVFAACFFLENIHIGGYIVIMTIMSFCIIMILYKRMLYTVLTQDKLPIS